MVTPQNHTLQNLHELSGDFVKSIARREVPLTTEDLLAYPTHVMLAVLVYQNWLLLSDMKVGQLGRAAAEPEVDL